MKTVNLMAMIAYTVRSILNYQDRYIPFHMIIRGPAKDAVPSSMII
jgi:uncharacterized protein (UPF0248 family)